MSQTIFSKTENAVVNVQLLTLIVHHLRLKWFRCVFVWQEWPAILRNFGVVNTLDMSYTSTIILWRNGIRKMKWNMMTATKGEGYEKIKRWKRNERRWKRITRAMFSRFREQHIVPRLVGSLGDPWRIICWAFWALYTPTLVLIER